ncbi:glycosyltransferase family 4 protein [Photobacterium sanguinicancri]|uniref:Glycosyltransferase family 4 protein n=1 Tax=Photobacterium sanguinicancri TaxID=875932 RepID=A0AAW7Y2A8_9GAMM|nr:glycosyltransferase family 4 protein [Photobacterium sanguinicancri]MDO6542491.1 glycosyltransferase family 4 protein [Photobacterium sanguinicancri]
MKTDLFFVHLYNDYSGSPRVFSDAIDIADDCLNINNKRLFTSNDEGFLSNNKIDNSYIFYKRSSNKVLQIIYFLLSQIHLFLLLSMRLISTRLKHKDINTVVVINTMLPFGAAIAAKLFAHKTIYYVHESHIKPNFLKSFLRFIIETTSDHVIFVSNYLLKAEKFSKPSMKVIYNGLRSDFPSTPTIDSRDKFNSKNVIFSGSLKEYKGVNYVIELSKLMPDFTFILALNCTVYEMDSYFCTMDLPENVTLLSRPKNLNDIYLNGFAVLNLSIPELWTETFGLSILEGMNYGCVPVVPSVGGPVEIVDGNCGLLCDSKDTLRISDFLTNLAHDFTLWKAFSDAAQNRSKRFSYDSFRENLKVLFNTYFLNEK